jgi:hypothetical protein
MADTELQFRGAIDRERGTKIVANEKLKSIQKFALVIITRFSIASQRRLFGAYAYLGHSQGAAKQFKSSWQINHTIGFSESESPRNLLFF